MTPSDPACPLKVFLCHAKSDKPAVRKLYQRLRAAGIDAWLDEEDLLPGQDWEREIPRAVRASDSVIVCLSCKSINKTGYVQKEIKFALDVADEQPEGAIFLIPLRLEECDVPERLSRWQWVDLFVPNGYERLMRALDVRATHLQRALRVRESEPDDPLPPSGSIVTLKTNHDFFVTLDPSRAWMLIGNDDEPSKAERFTLLHLSNDKIALKASHGRYVTALHRGRWALTADAQDLGEAQQFTLIRLEDGRVAFKTIYGRYVTAMDDQPDWHWELRAGTNKILAWEEFTLIPTSDMDPVAETQHGSKPPVSPTAAAASNVSGGVNLNSGTTDIGGDVTGRDKSVTTYNVLINHADNLTIGRGSPVSGSSDKEPTVSEPTVPQPSPRAREDGPAGETSRQPTPRT
jgi:hypothetical protein